MRSGITLASLTQHILPFPFSQWQQWQLVSNPWLCDDEAKCCTTGQFYTTSYTIFSPPVLAVVAGLKSLALYKFNQYL
jgi:hypothetical protein